MHTDKQLLVVNNAIAHRGSIVWWELHSSTLGHDQDELFLQFSDGTVLRIVAEHRTHGAALKLEPHNQLPTGRPVRNLTERDTAHAQATIERAEHAETQVATLTEVPGNVAETIRRLREQVTTRTLERDEARAQFDQHVEWVEKQVAALVTIQRENAEVAVMWAGRALKAEEQVATLTETLAQVARLLREIFSDAREKEIDFQEVLALVDRQS